MPFKISFSALRIGRRIGISDTVRRRLEDYTQQFANEVVSTVREYPPVPSDRYQRTYDLYRGWSVRNVSNGGGIRYEIRNSMPYAGLVHGPTNQWWAHRAHGWMNINQAIQARGGREQFRRGAQQIIDSSIGTGA